MVSSMTPGGGGGGGSLAQAPSSTSAAARIPFLTPFPLIIARQPPPEPFPVAVRAYRFKRAIEIEQRNPRSLSSAAPRPNLPRVVKVPTLASLCPAGVYR